MTSITEEILIPCFPPITWLLFHWWYSNVYRSNLC